MPRISVQRTKRELEVVYAFLMTMPGVPFVYYGDEIGLPYRADLPSKEGGFNRTGARTPMQWTDGKNAGFSEADAGKLYLPVDEHGVNVAEQLADDNSLLHTMQKLIALRRSSPALCADGEIEFVNRRHNGYPLAGSAARNIWSASTRSTCQKAMPSVMAGRQHWQIRPSGSKTVSLRWSRSDM